MKKGKRIRRKEILDIRRIEKREKNQIRYRLEQILDIRYQIRFRKKRKYIRKKEQNNRRKIKRKGKKILDIELYLKQKKKE